MITLHCDVNLLHILLNLLIFRYIFLHHLSVQKSHYKVVFGQDSKIHIVEDSLVLRLAFHNLIKTDTDRWSIQLFLQVPLLDQKAQ